MSRKVVGYTVELKKLGPPHVSLNNIGVVLFRRGKFDLAAEAFRKAIKLHPGCATLFYNLGMVLTKLGRHRAAEIALKRAGELDPNFKISI
ncbi:MAG: tetratricopeptide repeat protein [Patescibacteria group bacterium]